MAELASGAVTSLLGVIRNEWRLLGRVGGDVQFIREEMESMNSFLMHLARTVPPGGEHDEQVRTWMNQVRVLAHDCNNCIDLYLYRGNPDIHLGRDRLRRYLRWVPWFLQKMMAQHRAALELSVLKERARDVGKRRLRYGVEVPKKAAVAAPGTMAPAADAAAQGSRELAALAHADDGGEDGGHDQAWATTTVATDASGRIRRALFGLYVREDYFDDQLAQWIEQVRAQAVPDESQGRRDDTRCVAFMVLSMESGAIVARQASDVAKKHVKNTILIDIPLLHIWYALGPKNILYYILREIELKLKQQEQGQAWIDRWRIRGEKRTRIREIKTEIENLKVVEKIQEIKTQIEKVKGDNKKLQPYLTKPTQKEDYITKDQIKNHDHALAELLILLIMPSAASINISCMRCSQGQAAPASTRTPRSKTPDKPLPKLRELEVLDIQQTEVPKSFTRDLLLLKLKRLLAGNKNPSPHRTGGIGTSSHDHVLVPHEFA